jgi:hypothetical protein
MKKKILGSLTLVATLALFTGCGMATPPKVRALNKIEDKVVNINTLKDYNGNIISVNEIKNAIYGHMTTLSKYPLAETKKDCFRNLGGTTTCNYYERGVKFSKETDKVVINYVNGYYKKPTYSVKFLMPMNVKNVGNKTVISAQYPSNATIKNDFYSTANAKPYDTEDNLIVDVKSIYNKIFTAFDTTYISKKVDISGEVNTNYNDSSTYANFERLLGTYRWSKKKPNNIDITKEKYFNFKISNGSIVPLKVKVYPYKNKSKVVYSMTVPYKVYLNGKLSLTESMVNDLKNKIVAIAND